MPTVKRTNAGPSETELARLREMKPQERFGKGRGGYTMMPHGYFTILASKCSGWAQHFAIGYIVDRTFGAEGTPEYTKLSLPTLARLTGLTTSAFWLALDDAVRRGLVERKEVGKAFFYRTTPEAWILAADWDRKSKAEAAAPEAAAPEAAAPEAAAPEAAAPEAAAPEAAAPEAAAPEAAATEAAATEAISVPSGHSAKPIVLSVAIKGMEHPVDLRFQPRNESGLPLVFSTSINAGTVKFTVTRGEETANGHQVHFKAQPPANDGNSRLSALRAAVKPLFDANWNKPLDEPFLQRVATALGPEAPIDEYVSLSTEGIGEMRRKRRPVQTGILEFFARQSRAKWDEAAPLRRGVAHVHAEQQRKAVEMRPFVDALEARIGNSLADFRRITGRADAEVEEWFAAEAALRREFGIAE